MYVLVRALSYGEREKASSPREVGPDVFIHGAVKFLATFSCLEESNVSKIIRRPWEVYNIDHEVSMKFNTAREVWIARAVAWVIALALSCGILFMTTMVLGPSLFAVPGLDQ